MFYFIAFNESEQVIAYGSNPDSPTSGIENVFKEEIFTNFKEYSARLEILGFTI